MSGLLSETNHPWQEGLFCMLEGDLGTLNTNTLLMINVSLAYEPA